MPDAIWMEWVIMIGVCAAAAAGASWLLSPRRIVPAELSAPSDVGKETVFLFDGDDLVDSSDAANSYFDADDSGTDWQMLRDRLSPDYPDFPHDPEEVRSARRIFVPAAKGGEDCGALCEWVDGMLRVQLRTNDQSIARTDPAETGRELDFLRDTLDAAPYPIWRVGDGGDITWSNAAYARLARRLQGQNVVSYPKDTANGAPLARIFPEITPEKQPGRKSRVSIAADEHGARLWYDVSVVAQQGGSLCFAIDINAVVDAEVAQRNFVQTLAKTFAQLSIGLAIFDRNRQLALFNPALIDLTALPADFLSGRPNLLTFFDRLRDRKMMPEPKNYSSWRHQMADLLAAAADGRYQETWSLPSGSVYSVSGRPHPDGAVAFLFEDITAEITLTRRFRSELELGQSVMDRLDEAIAVFAPDGTLAFSNSAYNALWDSDPDRSFAQVTILDTTRVWQDKCKATPAWGDIRDFINARENRAEWWSEVQMRNGPKLTCSVYPISSGATMISFSQPIHQIDPQPARTRSQSVTG